MDINGLIVGVTWGYFLKHQTTATRGACGLSMPFHASNFPTLFLSKAPYVCGFRAMDPCTAVTRALLSFSLSQKKVG